MIPVQQLVDCLVSLTLSEVYKTQLDFINPLKS